MNVYDFDNTIYGGDCTADFYFYCLRKRPRIARRLPALLFRAVLLCFNRIDKTVFKERMFGFLQDLDPNEDYVSPFWAAHMKKIKPWYLNAKTSDDVVVSASPEFLLAPVCRALMIQAPIGSKVSMKTGLYDGVNCYGEEKVRRFFEKYPNAVIDAFYSDSLSDSPLADRAVKSYLVKGKELLEWPRVA